MEHSFKFSKKYIDGNVEGEMSRFIKAPSEDIAWELFKSEIRQRYPKRKLFKKELQKWRLSLILPF